MKKETIYSDAVLDTLFETLVRKFGSHDKWEGRHYHKKSKRHELDEFCEQFHKIIGNKSYKATGMVIHAAIINNGKSRLHIAARYFAVKNGFIKV